MSKRAQEVMRHTTGDVSARSVMKGNAHYAVSDEYHENFKRIYGNKEEDKGEGVTKEEGGNKEE